MTKITYHPALLKQAILNQAMELYRLGIEVEAEREKLRESVRLCGLSDPATVAQDIKVSGLDYKFAALEKKHIETTEQLAGVGKGAAYEGDGHS